MSDNLAKSLGKSLVAAKAKPVLRNPLHDPKVWEAARRAFKSGVKPPVVMHPVIIGEGTAIDSPQQLQELIDAPSLPEVLDTKTVFKYEGDEPVRDIKVCAITTREVCELDESAEYEYGPLVEFLKGESRIALRVLSIKPPPQIHENDESESSERA